MKSFAMPTHKDLTNAQYVNWKKFLAKTAQWTQADIEKYQLKQLQQLILLAYTETTGYRALYDKHNITPNSIRSLSDIKKLPQVTKQDMQNNLDAFTIPQKGSEYVTTGGSTAIPFGFYRTQEAFAKELASKAHQYHRIGWNESMRQLVLRGLPIKTNNHMEYIPTMHELRCSTYYMDQKSLQAYYETARRFKPQVLRCYPSAGATFAQYLAETEQKIPSIKMVLCASEKLYHWQKKLLEKTLGAKVFSHYGHYELCVLGGYCEYQDTYHILPQYGLTELVDTNNTQITTAGQTGEILGTSFIMNSTLFIRYKTQDRAIFKSSGCPNCNRPYQVWSDIDGRQQEFVVTGNNRRISMTALNMHDNTFEDIRQFQLEQKIPGEIEFRYISNKEINTDNLTKRLKTKLGSSMNIRYKRVLTIKPTIRGKHTFLIQHLAI